MGMFAGGYLYFTVFLPDYAANQDLTTLTDQWKGDFQLTGTMYGACDSVGCTSFSLSGNRQYKFDAGLSIAEEALQNGTVPRTLFNRLSDALQAASSTLAGGDGVECGANGKIYAHYVVTDQGETYTFESCDAQGDVARWTTELWRYVQDPKGYELPKDVAWQGVAGTVEEFLRENFGFNN